MDSPLNKTRKTFAVQVGKITIGGGAPIVVQSMTDTETAQVDQTVSQIKLLADAGSELVRITVNTPEAAAAVPIIRDRLSASGCEVPLVGDFHYNGHTLLRHYPDCARALAKYRINPGNVGFSGKRDTQFAEIIACAIEHDKPVRIGVNWGSLDQRLLAQKMDENARLEHPLEANSVLREALVASALTSAERAVQLGLPRNKIVISCKVSAVQDLIAVYRSLAAQCQYPLHLGLTEAGLPPQGIVSSSVAMGILLQEGIGDTVRTSLTPEPGKSRQQEVIVSQQILQAVGLRAFSPRVVSCPGCGRTSSTYFRELAQEITEFVQERMPVWSQHYKGVAEMTFAVMGCVVNGPGESKHAHIGISLPGTGESPAVPVFIEGKKVATLRGEKINEVLKTMIEHYVMTKYPSSP